MYNPYGQSGKRGTLMWLPATSNLCGASIAARPGRTGSDSRASLRDQ